MPSRHHYKHTYLKNLTEGELGQLDECCRAWGMHPHEFATRLDRWFENFDTPDDFALALQLLLALQYHSEHEFKDLLASRQKAVHRHLLQQQLDPNRIYFAVPDDLADSATRHAHPLAKVWQLPNEHFFAFRELASERVQRLGTQDSLVLFNDTYGSGQQFMRDVWPHVAPLLDKLGAVVIVGAVIAEAALALFQKAAKHGNKSALIVPAYATQGIQSMPGFTASQVKRLTELGQMVYPKHPLGFGACGLLLAYHFQCPNNSLPLIWADGKNNRLSEQLALPWTPLFAYQGKTRLLREDGAAELNSAPAQPMPTVTPVVEPTVPRSLAQVNSAPSTIATAASNTVRVSNFVPSAPAWASDFGVDEFGTWAEFCISGAVQRMRLIPAGEFLMGSPDSEKERYSNEGPQHKVRISQQFWLADTACTQALWTAVMQTNPSYFNEKNRGGPRHPVEKVSWLDVQEFLAKLKLPGVIATLPTEAEWEYACRAGSTTVFSFGDTISTEQVNFDGTNPYGDAAKGVYRERTLPVKTLPANAWGLYQMHGNVWEWCADTQRTYTKDAQTDPGLAQAYFSEDTDVEAASVLRGGCWFSNARHARSAYRDQYQRGGRDDSTGFRLLLRSSSKPSK